MSEAQAVEEFWKVKAKVDACMAGPEALEQARMKVAQYGDPVQILGDLNSWGDKR